jgi:hypothetical protein
VTVWQVALGDLLYISMEWRNWNEQVVPGVWGGLSLDHSEESLFLGVGRDPALSGEKVDDILRAAKTPEEGLRVLRIRSPGSLAMKVGGLQSHQLVRKDICQCCRSVYTLGAYHSTRPPMREDEDSRCGSFRNPRPRISTSNSTSRAETVERANCRWSCHAVDEASIPPLGRETYLVKPQLANVHFRLLVILLALKYPTHEQRKDGLRNCPVVDLICHSGNFTECER